MRIDIVTLFPGLFSGFKADALIKRALQKGLLELNIYQLRSWARSKHQQVDDYPFGGGPGMVMKPEPVFEAVEELIKDRTQKTLIIYFTPSGELLNQQILADLSRENQILCICGRYKGLDQRVIDQLVDRQLSVGDYVLSGGELPAMIMIEGVTRLIPGVINDIESANTDSFAASLLEGPLYTRPEDFRGHQVPEVLLSGDHKRIEDWRDLKAIETTRERRPDLWQRYLKKMIEEKNKS
ncbi:MAG: tRNA (guanosine(37)-N1)-methyltransferase TrmD [bacterium]|nr:tRNA (guanosine(37)-N1)-methyltransferase TrmD [bacterium]